MAWSLLAGLLTHGSLWTQTNNRARYYWSPPPPPSSSSTEHAQSYSSCTGDLHSSALAQFCRRPPRCQCHALRPWLSGLRDHAASVGAFRSGLFVRNPRISHALLDSGQAVVWWRHGNCHAVQAGTYSTLVCVPIVHMATHIPVITRSRSRVGMIKNGVKRSWYDLGAIVTSQETRDAGPVSVRCWPTVCDVGPTSYWHWASVSYLFFSGPV